MYKINKNTIYVNYDNNNVFNNTIHNIIYNNNFCLINYAIN